MPEANEVRRYADFMKVKLKNKVIEEVKMLKGRYKTHGPFEKYDKLKGKKVLDVGVKGKFIFMTLEDDVYLLCTLGLSGGWIFKDNQDKFIYAKQNYGVQYVENAENNLNVEFKVSSGIMYFYDQISYGTLKVVDNKKELLKKLSSIGPDIMDISTTFSVFKNQVKKNVNLDKHIGNVLMNQKVISGIGNYLRADCLWMSKISPFRKVAALSDTELLKIYKNVRALTWGSYDRVEAVKLKIMTKSIKIPDDYNRHFFVYDEEKDIKGNIVKKEELYEGSKKRSIYWVPTVQK